MVTANLRILNTVGIHARPASLLIDTVKRFQSTVTIKVGNKSSDCRSIITLLKLKAKLGDEVFIACAGEDEQACLEALERLIESRFGEE